MKQDNNNSPLNEFKEVAFIKPKLKLSKSAILDTKMRSTLSIEEKTDLIIRQLSVLKDNKEVKSCEHKHKQSVSQLMSSATTREEVLTFLVDNIGQINNNLKEHFEKSHKHSTLEELIILKDEYKKRNSRTRVASAGAPKGLRFESTYVPFTQHDRSLMLDSNLKSSTDRKETYNKIFDLLREDMRIIIKELNLDSIHASPLEKPQTVGYVHNHNNSYKFPDRHIDHGTDKIPKIDFGNTQEDDSVNLKTVIVKPTEVRSRSMDRQPRQERVRIWSWDKRDWERNKVNVKKDINHFIELKEELSESDKEEDEIIEDKERIKNRGDLLKDIYDLCCKFDLDDSTLRRMIRKMKHKDGIKEIINKERERVKIAEYQPKLETAKKVEVSVLHIENLSKIIETNKTVVTSQTKTPVKKSFRNNLVLAPKVETKSFKKHRVGLNLNNISNMSNSIIVPKKEGTIGKGYNKGSDLLKAPRNNDYLIISPKGQTTKNDTFFHSQFSDLRQSNRLIQSGDKGNSQTQRDILKNTSKDNTLGSFIFTPDYFTNPHTNPFTKNQLQYRPKTTVGDAGDNNTKMIRHNSRLDYSALAPRKINTSLTESSNIDSSRDSKVSRVVKKKAKVVDIDKLITQGVDESYVVLDNGVGENNIRSDEHDKASNYDINDMDLNESPKRINKPHYKNYMSNSMNEQSYNIVLKGSHLFNNAMISSRKSSLVIDPKAQILLADRLRDLELCGSGPSKGTREGCACSSGCNIF